MMLKQRAPLPILLCLLVACGGDDGDNDSDVLTGLFIGGVSGLHFQTATQQGLTGAGGDFSYRRGEMVTFALGGVTLGTAAASERLTPFDLFGVSPPSTEADFRRELRTRMVTGFDRAANVARFLVVLDVDGEAANGVDLTGWDDTLAGASLSFEAKRGFFEGRLDRFAARYVGVHRHLPSPLPLVRLYASLGISVAAHSVTGADFDVGYDGSIDSTAQLAYDAQGRVVTTRSDRSNDGTPERVDTRTYEARGLLATQVLDGDDDANGTLESRQAVATPTGAHTELLSDYYDLSTDGVVSIRQGSAYTYDARGNRLTSVYTADGGADGSIESKEQTTSAYDANGWLTSEVFESFAPSSEVVDRRATTTIVNDASGNQLSSLQENDVGADGSINTTSSVTSTYDSEGRRTSRYREERSAGVVGYRSSSASTFDASGNEVSSASAFGVSETTYLSSGVTTRTFDSGGRPLTELEEGDSGADGTVDSRATTTRTYDANGAETQTVREDDDNLDGTVDRVRTITATYGPDGNLLTVLTSNDSNADGTPDDVESVSYTYSVITDGVWYLLSEDLASNDEEVAPE